MDSKPGAAADLDQRVAAHSWYHTFDLPGGRSTPGLFDHRRIVDKLLLPERLDGLRCLDAASADGFFAFELKRRGAAEVVSLEGESNDNLDWQGPPGARPHTFDMAKLRERFDLVREATGLDVKRVKANLYHVTPEDVGTFDLVFVGNLLLHLKNPQGVLHSLWRLTRGELVSFEAVLFMASLLHPWLPVGELWNGPPNPRWWTPNVAAHRQLLRASGFQIIETRAFVFQPFGRGMTPRRRPRTSTELRAWLWPRSLGIPSSVVRARPERSEPAS